MAKEKTVEVKEVQPLTVPDEKINTVSESAARIARGEKVGHPGPWVEIKPRAGLTIDEELIELQKENRLVGYNPKTGKGIIKK